MDSYPNVWPDKGLFGFSGVDGDTDYHQPLVLSARSDGIGWNIALEPQPRLLANLGNQRLGPRNKPTDFVLPDCWYCSVRSGELSGVVEGAFVDRASIALTIAFNELPDDAVPDLFPVGDASISDDRVIFKGPGWWLAVVKSEPAPVRTFGLAYSTLSEDDALERATEVRDADLRAVINKRLGFYNLADVPDTIVDVKRRTYLKCAGVLKMNAESPQGRFTTRWFRSDAAHHRHVRLWDTAINALGLQHIHRELAHEAIEAVLLNQQPDGRVPLSIAPEDDKISPDFSHPPLLAWVVTQRFDPQKDAKFIRWCYPRLAKYVEWFETNRKRPNGLYGWKIRTADDPVTGARGAESAMSNSPRFDGVTEITAVDLSSYLVREFRSLEILSLELGLQNDAVEWRRRLRDVRDRVNALLWDTEDMFYYDLDQDNRFIPVKTTAGFMPLFGEIPDRDQAEALRTHLVHPHEFWTQFPAASVAEDEKQFSKDMWRGGTWPAVNLLLYHGLAAYKYYEEAHDLAHKTINEISYRYALTGCIYEYYDPIGKDSPGDLPRKGAPGAKGGAGFGVIEDYQPTAAAYIHLTHETARPS